MYKEVLPRKKRSSPPGRVRGQAYVRFTPKMLYISGPAMEMIGIPTHVGISINGPDRVMCIRSGGPWKLSRVCETMNARRIETNGGLVAMLDAGFPRGMIGKYLSVSVDMSGALIVSLLPQYDVA